MSERCPVEWWTDFDDEDGDGDAEHACFYPAGHDGDVHWCAEHFSCTPICGSPACAP